jgi:hypothetical protein
MNKPIWPINKWSRSVNGFGENVVLPWGKLEFNYFYWILLNLPKTDGIDRLPIFPASQYFKPCLRNRYWRLSRTINLEQYNEHKKSFNDGGPRSEYHFPIFFLEVWIWSCEFSLFSAFLTIHLSIARQRARLF